MIDTNTLKKASPIIVVNNPIFSTTKNTTTGQRCGNIEWATVKEVSSSDDFDGDTDDDTDDSDDDPDPSIKHQSSIEEFWSIIKSLNWTNVSDGLINSKITIKVLESLTHKQRNIFANLYQEYYDKLNDILKKDDMFARNSICTQAERDKIISHIIALGEIQYETLSHDMEFCQYFIVNKECQSLRMCMPVELLKN